MSKKLFTFLGTTNYKPTVYYFEEDIAGGEKFGDLKTSYVQLSLCKKLGYDTELIVFLTPEAREANWISKDKKEGLQEILKKEGINAKAIDIKNGKDVNELWDNFNTIFEEFDKETDVYVDITYSLRSIPIIFMALLSYARAVKKINIKGIYYGAFEVSETRKIDNEDLKLAPIFDLTFFNRIQDWANGTEKFLTTGDSRLLSDEIVSAKNSVKEIFKTGTIDERNEARLMESIAKNLKAYSEDLLSCRGKKIVTDCKRLKDELNKIKKITISDFTPFSKIIDQLIDKFRPYTGEVINDSIYAIEQGREFRLLQQSYTMLQETLITYLTIGIGLDYKEKKQRTIAEHIMNDFYYKDESNHELSNEEERFKAKSDEKIMLKIGQLYKEISDYRNDINHNGFSSGMHYSTFENNLYAFIERFKEIVNNSYKTNTEENLHKSAVSILSHKLLKSQEEELNRDWKVEKIVQLTEVLKNEWSNINPNVEIGDDSNLVDRLRDFILDNTNQEDYVIVQGEWGMTFTIVNMCFELNRVPIYATTERKTKETVKDGQVHSEKVFEHIRFRKYRI